MNSEPELSGILDYRITKRKLNVEIQTETDKPSKKQRSGDTDLDQEDANEFIIQDSLLLNLPDDVLLVILANLDSTDLLTVCRTCQRLYSLLPDRSLWRTVDYRVQSKKKHDLAEIVTYLTTSTKQIYLKGKEDSIHQRRYKNHVPLITSNILEEIVSRCPKLEVLRIENYFLPRNTVRIQDFPTLLTELSLAGCDSPVMRSPKSYFFRMDTHMPYITTLCLKECLWFEPHSLMVISKLPNLENLDLSRCIQLAECVPYFSLSCRFGFKKLKVFDLRGTRLADSEISCLNSVPRLTDILLECPSKIHDQKHLEISEEHMQNVIYIDLGRPNYNGGIRNQDIYFNNAIGAEPLNLEVNQRVVNPPLVNRALVDPPLVNRHLINQDLVDQPSVAQLPVDQPSAAQLSVNQAAVGQPSVNVASANQAFIDTSVVRDRASVDQPSVVQLPVDQPSVAQLPVDQAAVSQPSVNDSSSNQPFINTSVVRDRASVDQASVIDVSVDEPSDIDVSVNEHSVIDILADQASTSQASVIDTAVDKASVSQESVSDTSVDKAAISQESVIDLSVNEHSGIDTLADQASASRASVIDTAVDKASVSQESVRDTSVDKASIIQESVIDTSTDHASVRGATFIGASHDQASIIDTSVDQVSVSLEHSVIDSVDQSAVREAPVIGGSLDKASVTDALVDQESDNVFSVTKVTSVYQASDIYTAGHQTSVGQVTLPPATSNTSPNLSSHSHHNSQASCSVKANSSVASFSSAIAHAQRNPLMIRGGEKETINFIKANENSVQYCGGSEADTESDDESVSNVNKMLYNLKELNHRAKANSNMSDEENESEDEPKVKKCKRRKLFHTKNRDIPMPLIPSDSSTSDSSSDGELMEVGDANDYQVVRHDRHTLISDRSICAIGESQFKLGVYVNANAIEKPNEGRELLLERLVVRNFPLITDHSLLHLSDAAPRLRYLDVTGTKVTRHGIEKFKRERPDCEVISDNSDL